MRPLITNIQKYSIHDGPGIRTTVFFKGCPLKCIWCHNPETQKYTRQVLWDKSKCAQCGNCVDHCKNNAIELTNGYVHTDMDLCSGCGECMEYCYNDAREICGTTYSVDELVKELVKDNAFYEASGGGVTLSGGEVMSIDNEYVHELVVKLKNRGISVGIDTCGYAGMSSLTSILNLVDFFLYDIKVLDEDLHKKYTSASNRIILQNLKELSKHRCTIYIRIPVIGSVNDNEDAMEEIAEFIASNSINPSEVDLLPYHDMGKNKYSRMGIRYPGEKLYRPDNDRMQKLASIFIEKGFKTIIN